jgi:glycosyltransferase involved in cell wall biosynthesis
LLRPSTRLVRSKVPKGACVAFTHLVPLGSLPAAEVARCLAAASAFVSMALYEPFGLAVLEAAQAARPLVLSDIPTFRELWDGAALFVRPGDDEALAAALGGLMADAGARSRLSEAARRRAERYTMAAMVEGTLTAYHRLLAPRREAAA